MQFIYTTGWEDGVAELTERLARELRQGKTVLWLVSGGSNIPAGVDVMDNISASLTPNLNVMLADERYGATGHVDSNWQQLLDAGFKARKATLWPVLQGQSLSDTQASYEQTAHENFDRADVIIAQLGIGNDGHIAGILPGTTATKEKNAWVSAYSVAPYERLTLTFPALCKVTTAYVFAFGEAKQEALKRLHDKNVSPVRQPSQILKQLNEAYIYNDRIGD
jgi:6-phosphogluconolactonase/glucosamine-6-phosphate isomerase/deaminase